MKLAVIMGLVVLGVSWLALAGLERRKSELGEEIKEVELARLNAGGSGRRVVAERSERVVFGEVVEAARDGDDFFTSLEHLEGLDRGGLRALAMELLDFTHEKDLFRGANKAEMQARDVIFSALAVSDPLWFLEQAGESKSGLIYVAFQNLLEESPEDALRYYEGLGEARYSHPPGPGANYRLYQLVFNYMASRDAEAAADHLFAMDVAVRNLPPLEMWGLETEEEAKALWSALKNQKEDRHNLKSRAMKGAMERVYKLAGLEGMKKLWAELEAGDERRQFFNDSGLMRVFQDAERAGELQELLASESEDDRLAMLKNFTSNWGYLNRAGVDQWVRTLRRGKMRDEVLRSLLSGFREVDESPNQEWLEMIEGD